MSFVVNAWLERADPRIQILSGQTGDVLLSLDSADVASLLEQGDITVSELQLKNDLILALCIYSGLFASVDSKADFVPDEPTNTELQVPALFDYLHLQTPIKLG